MNLNLRPIESAEEARGLLPLFERGLSETSLPTSEEAPAESVEGLAQGFLARCFDRPESLLLVAEADGEVRALAATAPFEDPLTGAATPMLVLLWVDPAIRHRGVARALVQETRRLLATRGFPTLLARADHNDDALISMGERWGLVRAWEVMSSE